MMAIFFVQKTMNFMKTRIYLIVIQIGSTCLKNRRKKENDLNYYFITSNTKDRNFKHFS